jgi:hypothetical protein
MQHALRKQETDTSFSRIVENNYLENNIVQWRIITKINLRETDCKVMNWSDVVR